MAAQLLDPFGIGKDGVRARNRDKIVVFLDSAEGHLGLMWKGGQAYKARKR